MHVRNGTPEDAEAVLALWKAADATPSLTDSADELRRIAVRPEVAFLVAVVDGAIAGSIIAGFDGWRGNIYRLATHPDHRRRGVARALLGKAEEAFNAWGVRRITALVEKEHPKAVGFWRAVGYLDDTRIARYVRTLPALMFAVLIAALGCSSGGTTNDAATGGAGGSGMGASGGTTGSAGTSGGGTGGGGGTSGGLPGFGQACAPIAQQGDPQCAAGLVCVSVGAEQGRNLCTKTCTTADAPCTGGPAGSAPTCGRIYQVSPANSRVCEFFCDTGATNCPPGTSCLVDYAGMMTCQPPIR